MQIKVLYFAKVREQVGTAEEEVILTEANPTVMTLLTFLRSRGGDWKTALADNSLLKYAVNQRWASPDTLIPAGAEVAIFPPLTGG